MKVIIGPKADKEVEVAAEIEAEAASEVEVEAEVETDVEAEVETEVAVEAEAEVEENPPKVDSMCETTIVVTAADTMDVIVRVLTDTPETEAEKDTTVSLLEGRTMTTNTMNRLPK